VYGRKGRLIPGLYPHVCPPPYLTFYPSRCPSREDFPLIETEDEAYLRRIKSKFTHDPFMK
jgi:hypothetical protein